MAAPTSLKPVLAALLGNTFVTVIKLVAFVLSGSGAMLSEAIHSFADTGNQLLLFVGLCFYLIPALIVRKKAVVEVGLCDQHHKRRMLGILLGWLGFLVSLAVVIATMEAYPAVGVCFMFGMVVLPIVGIVMAQVVSATRIDDRQAWLKTGRPFLESIREGVY